MLIYVAFVVVVGGGRFLKFLRSEEEDKNGGMSLAGSSATKEPATGTATYGADLHAGSSGDAAPKRLLNREASRVVADTSYLSPGAAAPGFQSGALSPASLNDARRSAMRAAREQEIDALRHAKYFAPEVAGAGPSTIREEAVSDDDDDDDDDGDGDLGAGATPSFLASDPRRTMSFAVDNFGPKKPSKWTRAFRKTLQTGGAEGSRPGESAAAPPQYRAFAMPRYHKKALLKSLLERLEGEQPRLRTRRCCGQARACRALNSL